MGWTVRRRRAALAVALFAGALLAVPGLGGGAARAAVALEVTSSVSPSPVIIGDPATYTVTVRNSGDSAASNVQTNMTLNPAGSVATGTLPAGCTMPGPDVTCTAATVGAGRSVTYQIPVMISPSLSDGSDLQLTVTAKDAPGATGTAQPLTTQAVCAEEAPSPGSQAPASSPPRSQSPASPVSSSTTAPPHATPAHAKKFTPRAPKPAPSGTWQDTPPTVPVTG